MNIYNPTITELDEVYAYYEANKSTVTPPLGVQVGWNYRDVEWPTLEEVEDSTDFQRLEWARFLPLITHENSPNEAVMNLIMKLRWEDGYTLINSFLPNTPKQQLQHDGDMSNYIDEFELTKGLTDDELSDLL